MTKSAIISLVVFLFLLSLVFLTREESVAVGLRTMELSQNGAFLDAERLREVKMETPTTGGKSALTVLRKEGGDFRVFVGERAFESDAKSIDALKEAVTELRAGNFVSARREKHPDLEVDDIKGKKLRLIFDHESIDLVFGRATKGGGHFFRKAQRDEVFVAQGTLASLLEKDTQDWRERSVVKVAKEDISALAYERGDSKTEIRKFENQSWGLSVPKHPEFYHSDPALMHSAVSAFATLRAEGFEDSGILGSVVGKITATLPTGKKTLLVGQSNAQGQVKVQVEGEAQVYLLNEYSGRALLKGMADFRDLRFISFNMDTLRGADFQSAKGIVSVEKKDDRWTLKTNAPPGFDFDPAQVPAKLEALSRLKATKFYGPVGWRRGKDDVKITLRFEDGSVKKITLGEPVEGADADALVRAQGTRDPSLYGVPAFMKRRYENALTLFERAAAPAPGPPGAGMQGLNNLPPELREQILKSMQQKAP